MLYFVIICSLLVSMVQCGVDLNGMVDKYLKSTRERVIREHGEMIPIPDLDKVFPFGLEMGHKNLTWRLLCDQGYLKDLSTLKRTGDVVLTNDGLKYTLDATLGLGNLEFGFRRCNITLQNFFTVERSISATVAKNSIHSRVSVNMDGNDQCRPTLECLHVIQAGDIVAHTSGGIIDIIESKVFSFMVNHFHDELIGILVNDIAAITRKELADKTFCSQI